MSNVMPLHQYYFRKKEIQISIDNKDIDFLAEVFHNVTLVIQEQDNFKATEISLDSILEDLVEPDYLEEHTVITIHVLEVDSFVFALSHFMNIYDDVTESEKDVLFKYMDMLVPYQNIYKKEIAAFYNLPVNIQAEILELFYSSPNNTSISHDTPRNLR